MISREAQMRTDGVLILAVIMGSAAAAQRTLRVPIQALVDNALTNPIRYAVR